MTCFANISLLIEEQGVLLSREATAIIRGHKTVCTDIKREYSVKKTAIVL